MNQIRWIDSKELFEVFGYGRAIAAITALLDSGFDPSGDHPRLHVDFSHGQGLLMPSEIGQRVGLKFVTVAPANPSKGRDRIQGLYSLLDSETLTPILQCDGAALTLLRTASMTAAVVAKLGAPKNPKVAIFGSGPQAVAHAIALRQVTSAKQISLFARNPSTSREVISRLVAEGFEAEIGNPQSLAAADVVLTLTSSAAPVLGSQDVQQNVIIAAVGSHAPNKRELEGELMASGSVYVESSKSAMTEAGDVVMSIDEGKLSQSSLIEIRQLFGGTSGVENKGRRIYKSTGMSWQDLAIMAALERSLS